MALASSPRVWVPAAFLGGLFLAVYGPLVPGLVRDWSSHPILSHGFAIPLISGFLLWSRRSALQGVPIGPSRAGLVLLGVSLAASVVGHAAGEPFLARLSLVPALWGLLWAGLGWRFTWATAFPVGYLFFMIPPPFVVVKTAMNETRLFDAAVSAELLRVVGVPVYREGNFLHLPNMTLEVADPCSSVLAVAALSALAAAYAYMTQGRLLPRLLLIASSVPLAVASNIFRIVILSSGVYNFGPVMLAYVTEQTYGVINFLLFTMLLVVLDRLLGAVVGGSRPAGRHAP
jgi:exosortase